MQLAAALIGAVIGGVASYIATLVLQDRQAKKVSATRFFDEFNGGNMSKDRSIAFQLLYEWESTKDLRDLEAIRAVLLASGHLESWVSLLNVLRFWERVAVFVELGYVDKRLLRFLLDRSISDWLSKTIEPLAEQTTPNTVLGDMLNRCSQTLRDFVSPPPGPPDFFAPPPSGL